jgi:hypothetical protein
MPRQLHEPTDITGGKTTSSFARTRLSTTPLNDQQKQIGQPTPNSSPTTGEKIRRRMSRTA